MPHFVYILVFVACGNFSCIARPYTRFDSEQACEDARYARYTTICMPVMVANPTEVKP
jgi:hypothetical protein